MSARPTHHWTVLGRYWLFQIPGQFFAIVVLSMLVVTIWSSTRPAPRSGFTVRVRLRLPPGSRRINRLDDALSGQLPILG